MTEQALEWLHHVQVQHGVDPLVFAVLWVVFHVGLFYVCVGLAAVRFKRGQSLTHWLAGAAFNYFLPYFYIMLFGRNLPPFVWALIALLMVVSFFVMRLKLRARLASAAADTSRES